ncbi:MAG: type II toxin-antitoxin system VapC family toxin [Deltaproteobacteria bacterium]|nr:type II toxin-antitoxin system VapC family toxin [Deltaproteobacteria bacterium]
MRVCLDTNRYRDLIDGKVEVVRTLEEAISVHLPFAVLAELLAGFAVGTRRESNQRTLRSFLSKSGVETLYPDEGTAEAYASLYAQLRAQGTPIPTHGLWIAALSMQHGLALYSRDAHFANLPQLHRI